MTALGRIILLLLAFTTQSAAASAQAPRRIVSLAPSVTEVLFEIGAGDRVAGVTTYCVFPKAALGLPKVGGYLTPSYEALVGLAPDLVVVLPEHRDIEHRLAALGPPVLRVDHGSLDGIVDSLRTLGRRCGVDAGARVAANALRQRLEYAKRAAPANRPRVLLCFGRSADFRRMYAAARGTVHDDLLTYAGADNALIAREVAYPTLSVESVMRLDPDVIVEFAPGAHDPDTRRQQWYRLGSLRAVKAGRVHIFTDSFLSVPGPRFVRFVETLARALHAR
ncbi:MAG TPA: helical backbone metal receptor [Vicinamibacterales bacterium]|nr:helical backbone metal receptor [Vicinamibacterales bacterium]